MDRVAKKPNERMAWLSVLFSALLILSQAGHTAPGAVDFSKKTENTSNQTVENTILEDIQLIQESIQELKYKNSEHAEKKISNTKNQVRHIDENERFLEGAVRRANLGTTSLTYLVSIRSQLKLNRERAVNEKNNILNTIDPFKILIKKIQSAINNAKTHINNENTTYQLTIDELLRESTIVINRSSEIISHYEPIVTQIINIEKSNLNHLDKLTKTIKKKHDLLFINQGWLLGPDAKYNKSTYNFKDRIKDSLIISKNYLYIYWKTILSLLIISISATWLLRRKNEDPKTKKEKEKAIHSLEYPISSCSSAFILLFFSALSLAPTFINFIIFILATFPVLRFGIHKRLPETKMSELIIMAGFISLFLISVAPVTIYSRLLIILINILIGYCFFRLFNISRKSNQIKHAKKAIIYLFGVSLLVSFICVFINIYGYYSLSFWLTHRVVFASYFGFIVYAVCRSTQLTWEALCYSGASSRINTLHNHRALISKKGKNLIGIISAIIWPLGVLSYWGFDIQPAIYITHLLKSSFSIGSLNLTPGPIILFVFFVWATFKVASASKVIFNEEIVPRSKMKKGVPLLIGTAIQIGVTILGFVFAMVSSGINLSNITLVVSALSVGIGLGLQSVVLNFVSGIILMIERPIRTGDSVELKSDALMGQILTIGLRTTTIRTYDGADVVVPNSQLTTEQVVNWTLASQQRRVIIDFGVAYGSNPTQVIDLVMSILDGTDYLLQDPPPTVVFVGLGESSLDFQAKYWVAEFSLGVSSKSELLTKIYSALNDHDIAIPFPQRDIYIKQLPDQENQSLLPDTGQGSASHKGKDAGITPSPAT